jgi:hypothetical protein
VSPRRDSAVAVTGDSARLAEHFIYEELDLDEVGELAARDNGWDEETVNRAKRAYRDFLWMCWNFGRGGDRMAWISILADRMWHSHMHLPAAYLAATEEIFGRGYIIDHTPVMPNRQRVCDDDRALAIARYVDLGVVPPSDLRAECTWAIVRF